MNQQANNQQAQVMAEVLYRKKINPEDPDSLFHNMVRKSPPETVAVSNVERLTEETSKNLPIGNIPIVSNEKNLEEMPGVGIVNNEICRIRKI